jgi:hypothetical protein
MQAFAAFVQILLALLALGLMFADAKIVYVNAVVTVTQPNVHQVVVTVTAPAATITVPGEQQVEQKPEPSMSFPPFNELRQRHVAQ